MKKIAEKSFSISIHDSYGDEGVTCLPLVTDAISTLYKYIDLNEKCDILVFKSFKSSSILPVKYSGKVIKVSDFAFFSANSSYTFAVEIVSSEEIYVLYDTAIDIQGIIPEAVVYRYAQGQEFVYCLKGPVKLERPPDISSYFAFPTFRSLENAFQHYYLARARKSTCPFLKQAWIDEKQIFFSPKPEEKMRKSLYDFLSLSVRAEVREEQNVNDTEPVDIKITWGFSSHIALIEIKWLGKSIERTGGEKFNQIYTDSRAKSGAKQLADYLDQNKLNTSRNVTKGYLVVFDGRRWQTSITTTDLDRNNGYHFENKEVNFDPDYTAQRSDFAKPTRFFMEPRISN
ncbi:hypothetical protein [Chitinophaga rhizosphaerae]|uniref:hypothetical protein n=1 Tax=Chitinophaga rhizosphaerae TaxID=1864947 RepID=UPI000F815116|nr:hypothetical protein [Chitinophaga rhizosphaerae]